MVLIKNNVQKSGSNLIDLEKEIKKRCEIILYLPLKILEDSEICKVYVDVISNRNNLIMDEKLKKDLKEENSNLGNDYE